MTRGVLFDLDGTLADTAPDLGGALNRQRAARGFAPLPIERIRPEASNGARGLLRLGFGVTPEDAEFGPLREEFLAFYAEAICRDTVLFAGVAELLDGLERRGLPWGVVTNKPHRYTVPLMEALGLATRAASIVSADLCPHPKPHPAPLLMGSRDLDVAPEDCIYVGDDRRDTEASLAAGMRSIVAGYGYLGTGGEPGTWGAHAIIDRPQDLLRYL